MLATVEQDQKDYRVVRLAGRPIIATPARPLRLRLAGFGQYRPITKKRAFLRAALRFSAISGIDRLFARACVSPFAWDDDFGFERWLHEMRSALRAPSSLATVIWPQLVGRKRIYVHLMSPTGAPIAFCKIGLDAHNARRLRTELDALMQLGERRLTVRIPRILHHDSAADHCCIAYEPFPPDLVPLKHDWLALAPALADISGRVRYAGRDELERCTWWQDFVERGPRYSREFLRQVDDALARPISVCRVQGDATPSNAFRSGTEIWICDWEFSSPSGPRRIDELSYYLAANHYRCLFRPVTALAACVRYFVPERNRESISSWRWRSCVAGTIHARSSSPAAGDG